MKDKQTVLLVDISNGRTKFRMWHSGGIGEELRVLPTHLVSRRSVLSCLRGWSFDFVLVSSVVPTVSDRFASFFDVPVQFLKISAELPVDFSFYRGAATLGADRIANVLGAATYGFFPAVVIDLGTAVTFDVVTACNGDLPRFLGGAIAPGLSVFREYLPSRTALLPSIEWPAVKPAPIGVDTMAALSCGAFYGWRGMIREILNSICTELGEPPFVIATGGDAARTAELLPEVHAVDPYLTFKGMSLLLESES